MTFRSVTFGLSVAVLALSAGLVMAQDEGGSDGIMVDPAEGGWDGEVILIDDGAHGEADGGIDPASGGEADPGYIPEDGEVPPESECGGCEYWTMADGPVLENARGDDIVAARDHVSSWDQNAWGPPAW
jgi:hypothetical protein